jgi:hypothetical protein
MVAGTAAGTNLLTKEGCFDPTQTTCTEKLRWLHAPLGKIGSLEITGAFQGSFEITVIGDFDGGNKGISLTTSENKGIQYHQENMDSCCGVASLYPISLGEGGNWTGSSPGWNGGTWFNAITITVQNGLAKARINGAQIGADVTFDPASTFDRIVIQGITADDRLTEVRTTGVQSACSGNTTSSGSFTQADLDAAYQRGYQAGTTASTSGKDGGIPGIPTFDPITLLYDDKPVVATLASNLNLHIPFLAYKDLAGSSLNLWADLQFVPGADGSLTWKLSNYGMNQ